MNNILILQGLIEIVLSVLSGLLIFLLSFRFFDLITRDIDEVEQLKNNNTAVALFIAAFIFGILLIVKSTVDPTLEILKNLFAADQLAFRLIMGALGRIVVIYLAAALFAFLILWFTLRFFMLMTRKIDEMKQINDNNLSIALVITVFILCITLLISDPIKSILNSLVLAPQNLKWGIQRPVINIPVFIQGLLHLTIAILAGIAVFFFSFKILSFLTRKIDEIEELKKDNLAIAILTSSFIGGIMILVRAAIKPINKTLDYLFSQDMETLIIFITLLKIIGFFFLTAIFAFFIIWVVMQIFMAITRQIDELAEIKNRNVAVSIIIAVFILTISLLLEHGLTILLSGLIPLPQVGTGIVTPPVF
ncbi:MAG: DUF350 domain-containing protein [Spirochaetes bacterium]|nr:DUF350 domain-containing protein [Spirochaetota bacterium]